jgi:uncharacterized protein YecT (DUF1311 family)
MKFTTVALTFSLLMACSGSIFAQDASQTKPNPIDVLLQKRLDSSQNQTTAGMISCEAWAKDAWDKELNKYYKLLMGTLSADEKETLKKSQINWLTYRDSESKFSSQMYTDMEGTMWRSASVSAEVEIIKQRALELKAYYSDKTEGQ